MVTAGLHRSHTEQSGYTQVRQGYTRIRPCDTQVMAQLGYTPVTAGLLLATPRHCRVTPGVRQGHANGTPRPKLRQSFAESPCASPRVTPVGLADGEIDADHVGAGEGEVRGWLTVSPKIPFLQNR